MDFTGPNQADTLNGESEQKQGPIEEQPIFDLEIPDRELAAMLWEDIQDSRNHWDNFLHTRDPRASNVRELGEKIYKGEHYGKNQLYDHNERYVDPRIFVDIDTLLPMITNQLPEPIVEPATEAQDARKNAEAVQQVLSDGYVEWGLKKAFKRSLLHLLTAKRIGVIKGRFDPDKGQNGQIIWESVRPETIVVDKHAVPGTNPRFVAQFLEGTVDDLVHKFPKKKREIFKEAGIVQGTMKQMTRRVGYIEVWFTYRDKDTDKMCEGVCWFLNRLVLGKMKDPNWIELEDGKTERHNFLDEPEKPFKFLSLDDLNFGKHFLDDTSLLEQALPAQDTLNKRGRQIGENADHASSGWVYDTTKLPPEAAEELVGDPNEKIGVAGDVRAAIARYPANNLPQYVVNEKEDARNAIDVIYAAQRPTRGEKSGNPTLGQDLLQTQQNIARNEGNIASALEGLAKEAYCYSVQLMKVHFTEAHFIKVRGPEGKLQFLAFSDQSIQDGSTVKVKEGSLLPTDKFTQRNEAMQLFQADALDLLTLYERMDIPNPMETYKRWLQFKTNPQSLADGESQQNPEMMEAVAQIKQGGNPPMPAAVDQSSIATITKIIKDQGSAFTPGQKQQLSGYVSSLMARASADPAQPAGASMPQV